MQKQAHFSSTPPQVSCLCLDCNLLCWGSFTFDRWLNGHPFRSDCWLSRRPFTLDCWLRRRPWHRPLSLHSCSSDPAQTSCEEKLLVTSIIKAQRQRTEIQLHVDQLCRETRTLCSIEHNRIDCYVFLEELPEVCPRSIRPKGEVCRCPLVGRIMEV